MRFTQQQIEALKGKQAEDFLESCYKGSIEHEKIEAAIYDGEDKIQQVEEVAEGIKAGIKKWKLVAIGFVGTFFLTAITGNGLIGLLLGVLAAVIVYFIDKNSFRDKYASRAAEYLNRNRPPLKKAIEELRRRDGECTKTDEFYNAGQIIPGQQMPCDALSRLYGCINNGKADSIGDALIACGFKDPPPGTPEYDRIIKIDQIDMSVSDFLAGRKACPETAPKAAKQCRKSKKTLNTLYVFIAILALPCMLLRVFGGIDARIIVVLIMPFMILLGIIAMFIDIRSRCYTGTGGYELQDGDGSPYVGRLVTKKGHIRLINLICCIPALAVGLGMTVYFAFIFGHNKPDDALISLNTKLGEIIRSGKYKDALVAIAFPFSIMYLFSFMFCAMIYGGRYLFDRVKKAVIHYLPSFLLISLIMIAANTVIHLLISLFAPAGAEDAVVSSFTERILGDSLDISSIGGFLGGETSLMTALSTTAVFTAFFDILIDNLDSDRRESFTEQLRSIVTDRSTIYSLIFAGICFAYVALTRLNADTTFFGVLLRIVFFISWLVSGYNAFKEFRLMRYLIVMISVMCFDTILAIPDVKDFKSVMGALGMFALRTVVFLLVGVLIAIYFKSMRELAVFQKDPSLKKILQTTDNITVDDIIADSRRMGAVDDAVKQERKEVFDSTAAGKAVGVAKKTGKALFKLFFDD